jgi:L-ascorbate oxidase
MMINHGFAALFRSAGRLILALVLTFWGAGLASGEELLSNPRELPVLRGIEGAPSRAGAVPSGTGPVERVGNEAQLTLDANYTYYRIWNPSTKRFDQVRLRGYNGTMLAPPTDEAGWAYGSDPVGPTIRLKPGETARVTLINDLPPESCVAPEGTHNIPNCFNITNLHAHGLHVTPSGNGDNVLIEIQPGETFQYEYNLPFDHPAGTFWYHPHRHGSTALQVSSGMAGALIVEGTRQPKQLADRGGWLPGDIDLILRPPKASETDQRSFKERILLFEQIQYACRENGQIKTIKNRDGNLQAWKCDPGDTGGVEGYDQFGPGTWTGSGRYTLVNGRLQPVLANAKAGEIERWRLIHAGVRDTIKLAIYEAKAPGAQLGALNAEQRDKWTADNCSGAAVGQWEIATDGLTRPSILRKGKASDDGKAKPIPTLLEPGYRSDVLVVFPKPGDYCLIDEAAPANDTVNLQPKNRRLLAAVHADAGDGKVEDTEASITAALVAAAESVITDPEAKAKIIADLKNHLRLDEFVPHRTIEAAEVKGHQSLVFSIDTASPSPSNSQTRFGVDHHAYSAERIDRTLVLGSADEWDLGSTLANHPFHIHVNPFQIVEILDPKGKDVSGFDPDGDPEFLGLKGTWKDTIFVKEGYRVIIRSRYERYVGDFVLHCHILDHEDQGMMQNVRISLSGRGETHGNH